MAEAVPVNADVASAIAEAETRFTAENPKSKAQFDAAAAALPGGNTRTVLYYRPFPLTITHGQGCRLTDLDNHSYIDVLGEYTAGLYGHSNPVIRRAIDRALDDGIVFGGQNQAEAELARVVVDRFPAIERVRFTNSGTEANLMAVSAARAFTGRPKVMVMEGGYHGGILYFAPGGSPLNAPFAYVMGRYNDIDQCRDLIRTNAEDLACVLLEPMMGSGGCIRADDDFLQMLRAETRNAGALLIFDEVMTSRLTPGGLQQATGVMPDLTTLGKYIGGGMSFGGFGGRADILDRFDPTRPGAWPHAGTFNNNTLTMRAGYAGLTEVYTPECAVALNQRGDRLRAELNALADSHDVAVQFTGQGSMICVHFRRGAIRNVDDVMAGRNELRPLFHLDLLSRGIYAAARGMFALTLPLGEPELASLTDAVDEFFRTRRSLLTG